MDGSLRVGTVNMAYFRRWLEGPSLFLLLGPSSAQYLIPKRALSQGMETALRDFLLQNIGPQGETREGLDAEVLAPLEESWPLVMEFSLTRDDVQEASRLYQRTSSGLYAWGFRVVVCAAVGLMFAHLFTERSLTELLGSPAHGLATLALLVFMLAAGRRQSRLFLANAGLEGRSLRCCLRDDVFFWEAPLYRGERRLAAFTRWMEGPNLFLLFESGRASHILPKRALSESQMQTLRSAFAGVGSAGQGKN